MRKVKKAIAMGSVIAVITVGSLLYALYSNGSVAYGANRSGDANSSNTIEDQHLMVPSNGNTGEASTASLTPQIPSVPLPSDGLGGY